MPLPGESASLATGCPLQRVILMTTCSGSCAGGLPRSLVRWVPMPKANWQRPRNCRYNSMVRVTVSASLKISVLLCGSTRSLRYWASRRSPQANGSPLSWRAPSKSLQKYRSKSRRNALMPYTSDSAMPRSPRYSLAHISKPNTWLSRNRGPRAWQACRYSCAIVPSGVTPSFIAYSTLLVPANCPGPAGASAHWSPVPRRATSTRKTSSCQARLKRRRGGGWGRVGAGAQAGHQHAQALLMPGAAKAPARAVIGDLQLLQALGLQQRDLGVEPSAPFGKIGHLLRVAKVHLVDDGQHRNLEQDGVQPRPANADIDLAAGP